MISPANKNDVQQLALVEIESKMQSLPHLVQGAEIDLTLRIQRWESWYNGESPQTAKPERKIFKAVDDKGIIGFIAGQLTTRFSFDAEIQSFYLLKETQRKGVGTQLFHVFYNG